jgi:hypothetical protein
LASGTAPERVINAWSTLATAIKASANSTYFISFIGQVHLLANGTAPNLGSFFVWGIFNPANNGGTLFLTPYYESSDIWKVSRGGSGTSTIKKLDVS